MCKGICRGNKQCTYKIDGFCKRHKYQELFTTLENLKECSGCKMMYEMTGKICEKCKNRGTENNKKNRKEKVQCYGITQKNILCSYKGSYTLHDKTYCKKHFDKLSKLNNLDYNKIMCSSRWSCGNTINKNGLKWCEECRKRDSDNSKRLRDKKKVKNIIIIEENKIDEDEINDMLKEADFNLICTKCGDEFKSYKTKSGKIGQYCQKCYFKQCMNDKNRKPRNRDWKQELENNPERAKKKEDWKELNSDKQILYWREYRKKRMEKEGVEEYKKKNAEGAKKWRVKNPEKTDKFNAERRNDPKIRLQTIKYCAEDKGINFDISDEYALKIINSKCVMCDGKNKESINGIDRVDCNNGYTYNNVVSCCNICNKYIKGSDNEINVINKIEHILSYNGFVDGKLNLDSCLNSIGTSMNYAKYKNSANKRKKEFLITKDKFDKTIVEKCYICEKENSDNHTNGIDRYDNNIGYTSDNIRCCCGHCNRMKGSQTYDDFIDRLKQINKRKDIILRIYQIVKDGHILYDLDDNNINILMKQYKVINESKGNEKLIKNFERDKKTKEEKTQRANERKKKSNEGLLERYGKDYTRLRSLEICCCKHRKKIKLLEQETDDESIKLLNRFKKRLAENEQEFITLKEKYNSQENKENYNSYENKKLKIDETQDVNNRKKKSNEKLLEKYGENYKKLRSLEVSCSRHRSKIKLLKNETDEKSIKSLKKFKEKLEKNEQELFTLRQI